MEFSITEMKVYHVYFVIVDNELILPVDNESIQVELSQHFPHCMVIKEFGYYIKDGTGRFIQIGDLSRIAAFDEGEIFREENMEEIIEHHEGFKLLKKNRAEILASKMKKPRKFFWFF